MSQVRQYADANDGVRRLTTDEERTRLDVARKRGEACGVCGRVFAAGEVAWIERVIIGTKLFSNPAFRGSRVYREGPVGSECASALFRERMEGMEPASCGGCERGLYYDVEHRGQLPAACSTRCRERITVAKKRESRNT